MSIFINTLSAIGNNSSVYPLLVRDCGIEIPTKLYQTYNQNKKESKCLAKHALRERSIDEYLTTAAWIGAIPCVEYGFNKLFKSKNLNGKVSYKLLEQDNVSKTKPINQSLEYNIKKFKNLAPNEVKELEAIKNNKTLFKNLTISKYVAAILVPISLMGFIIPKANFKLSKYLMDKDAKKGLLPEKYLINPPIKNDTAKFDTSLLNFEPEPKFRNLSSFKTNNSPSFKGFASFMSSLTPQQKMLTTDAGYAVGRVVTARKKNEMIENGFKMSAMMYLNFVAPKQIEKGLDFLTKKLFGINPSLDSKIIANERFLALIKNDKLELPKTQDEVLDFLDSKPKSLFSQVSQDVNEVKYLKSGVRDPRYYVNTEKVYDLAKKMEAFANDAKASSDIKKYAKKAIFAKSLNVFSNIVISSTLLAVALPQAQFLLRKLLFKSDVEPGLS